MDVFEDVDGNKTAIKGKHSAPCFVCNQNVEKELTKKEKSTFFVKITVSKTRLAFL